MGLAHAGFNFAYNLNGANVGPVVRDFYVGGSVDVGDLLVFTTGTAATASGTAGTADSGRLLGVAYEAQTSGTALRKVAIFQPGQVWANVADGTPAAAAVGLVAFSNVDKNTIDASDSTNGIFSLVDRDADDQSIVYVSVRIATFGG